MDNKELNHKKDIEILKRLCRDEGIRFKLMEKLIQVERKHQLGSRHGVINAIEDIIREFSKNDI